MTRRSFLRVRRARVAFLHDVLMAAASFPLSLYLRVGNEMPNFARSFLFEGTLMFTAVAAGVILLQVS